MLERFFKSTPSTLETGGLVFTEGQIEQVVGYLIEKIKEASTHHESFLKDIGDREMTARESDKGAELEGLVLELKGDLDSIRNIESIMDPEKEEVAGLIEDYLGDLQRVKN